MSTTTNKYITVSYDLYTDFDGNNELVEKATSEHPFQFISGMGTTLDAFEAHIMPLGKGDNFDFTLSVDDAYGPYEQERVLQLDKSVFTINGKFDTEHIYPGAVVPLMNDEGARFNGTIVEIADNTVTVDLNHPFAGKELHFIGKVEENREATKEEIQSLINMLTGEGCGGNCGGCGGGCDEEGSCGCSSNGCGCH